jgi:protein O-mannosyl-transferase
VSDNSIKTLIQKNRTTIYLLLILLFTFLVHSSSIFNGFLIWDDDRNVYQNPAITVLNFQHIKQIFSTYYIGMYQPLTTLSYALNFKLTGMNPAGFHVGNILFHLLNTLLVFFFIRGISNKTAPALLTALFFGIHPMFVESVAWVSERKDVLYAFFFLLSLIFYVEYVRKKKGVLLLLLSFLMFGCSVLSKSTALLLPLLLILIDWYLKRNFDWKQLTEKILFLIISIIIAVVALNSQYSEKFTDYSAYQYSIFDRPFLAANSILFYIYMFFLPFKLSIIYPYPDKTGIFLPTEYYLAFIVLIILIYALYRIIKKSEVEMQRLIIFGVSFFIIMLLLCLHFIALPGFSVSAERYAYIPYIGLFFVFSMVISNLDEKSANMHNQKKYYFYILITIIVVFFSISTYSRNKVWKSNISIFSDAVVKHPDAAMPYNNRGLAYSQDGDIDKAITDFTKAVELKPGSATYHYNLGNAYLAKHNYPMAVKCYTSTITINRGKAEAAYINRGIAYQKSGFYIASYWDLTAAINLNGQFTSIAYFNRGSDRIILNDKKGACSDWQTSLNMGYTEAQSQLLKYCK